MAKSKPDRGVSLYKGKAAPVLQKIEIIFRLSSAVGDLSGKAADRRPKMDRLETASEKVWRKTRGHFCFDNDKPDHAF